MIFDDWGIPASGVAGLTRSDSFFDHGPFSGLGDGYGEQPVVGLDRPGAGLDGYGAGDFAEAFGSVSVLDALVTTPFLVQDEPAPTNEPAPGSAAGFGMSYSMRMLIDMPGGHGGSFSRMASWR